MKSFIICFILCGLVFLVGCGSDSAKPPVVPPGSGTDVWQITALVSSPSDPLVNTGVTMVATVVLNGSAAPDGSEVKFSTPDNGGVAGFENGAYVANTLTSGGQASIQFGSDTAGAYVIDARVKSVTSRITIVYKDPGSSDSLQIYNVNPSSGSYFGGEVVVLTGKGIKAPVEVYFSVQGVPYQAIVDQVVESVPLSSAGSIRLLTPEPTAADKTVTFGADVRTVAGVGTTVQQEQTLPQAFTYVGNTEPPPGVAPTPVIFGVDPYWGRSAGGETVTILGMNFMWDDDGLQEETFTGLTFLFRGQPFLPQIERVSATQIEVITPRFSVQPLDADEMASIRMVPINGENEITKVDAFIVMSDLAIPEVTGLSPTAGPLDGGTVVSISGHGFELPLQVHFGVLEATGVQLFNDQSLADNDVITCTTPDYSQQGRVPPLEVEVKVTNLGSGLNSIANQFFRYGDVLYVSQANPTEGQIGDLLTLYGAGFEDPLTVWFSANIEFDVISVTGTEITLRSPPDLAPTCSDRSGTFRVVLNESNQSATGGNYNLLGSAPTITSVEPIFVNEIDNGNGVVPGDIDIYGVRFAEELLVLVENYTIDPSSTTVETAEHIFVSGIPAPNDFGLVFNTTSCTTGTGLQGIKEVATPVDVTVRNLPLGCEDTLAQTLVYVPQDETCVVAPILNFSMAPFPATDYPGPSAPQTVILNNTGGGDLLVSGLFLSGQFYFDAGCANQAAPGFTVPAFTNGHVGPDVYFCPNEDNGISYGGELRVVSNNVSSPNGVVLSGTEAAPIVGVSINALTFPGPYPQQLTFDVTNTGTGDLNYTTNLVGANFSIDSGGAGLVAPGGSATVTVEATADTSSGTVTVTATELDAQSSPQVVNLDAPAP